MLWYFSNILRSFWKSLKRPTACQHNIYEGFNAPAYIFDKSCWSLTTRIIYNSSLVDNYAQIFLSNVTVCFLFVVAETTRKEHTEWYIHWIVSVQLQVADKYSDTIQDIDFVYCTMHYNGLKNKRISFSWTEKKAAQILYSLYYFRLP